MRKKMVGKVLCAVFTLAGFSACGWGQSSAQTSIHNQELSVSTDSRGAEYQVAARALKAPVFKARVGVEVNHQWVWSTDYPDRKVTESSFQDALGAGQKISVALSGLAGRPDLSYTLELYNDHSYGTVRVTMHNTGPDAVEVQDIRVVDVNEGSPRVNLGAAESSERVLSDSYSEDRPPLTIFDLGKAKVYEGEDSFADTQANVHFAVGSQLIYNRESRYSLLLAALTSDQWVTLYHLNTSDSGPNSPRVTSYTVDSTGTTEVMKKESLQAAPPENQIQLSIKVPRGQSLDSERVLFTVGRDYHRQLEDYGKAIRALHHPRISRPAPWGWWSWTAFYFGLNQGTALTNAAWLSQNLRSYGYNYFHIDEGYLYADGESTANALNFPDGIKSLGYKVAAKGLRFGIWVAPFRVSERSWVFEKHPDWLVHNAQGKPIQIGYADEKKDPLYVLDVTNPEAAKHLQEEFETFVHLWKVRYIKMDFMDDTAIEGFHFRPNTTAVEAERIGLQIIRDAVGPDVLLDKDGSQMLPPVGLVDLGRISLDTGHSFAGNKEVATGIAARYYMNGNFFVADPDAFGISRQVLHDQTWHQSQTPSTLDEAQVSITLAAMAGGMFEIGDDLPTLGSEPDRVALLRNTDLLNMVRLGRSATPVDLMTYRPQDEQPSIFYLKEDKRQSMLAVFNWTEQPQSHDVNLTSLGYGQGTNLEGIDVYQAGSKVQLSNGVVHLADQAPHSVRLIKLVDPSVPAQDPVVKIDGPSEAQVGQTVSFQAKVDPDGPPAIRYHWDFGNGTTAEGMVVQRAFTQDGTHTVTLTAEGIDQRKVTGKATIKVGGAFHTTYNVEDYRRYEGDPPRRP